MFDTLLAQPEGKTLEFKRDLSSPKPLLKTLVAFANTAGGRLVVRVDDQRQVVGVAQPLDDEERLCNLTADGISPRLVPQVEMVTVQDQTLLVVEVFVSGSRPHWLKADGPEQGVYVRLGPSSRQADPQLIEELRRSALGIAFDEMPMPHLSADDLDLNAARQLFQVISPLDDQALRTLKLLTEHHVPETTDARLESQLESALAAKVVMALAESEAGKAQLARFLGHQTVSGELHKQVKRLLNAGFIEMTLPHKPNSRLQKYRLTPTAHALLSSKKQ